VYTVSLRIFQIVCLRLVYILVKYILDIQKCYIQFLWRLKLTSSWVTSCATLGSKWKLFKRYGSGSESRGINVTNSKTHWLPGPEILFSQNLIYFFFIKDLHWTSSEPVHSPLHSFILFIRNVH
jgi:hypothetical protein